MKTYIVSGHCNEISLGTISRVFNKTFDSLKEVKEKLGNKPVSITLMDDYCRDVNSDEETSIDHYLAPVFIREPKEKEIEAAIKLLENEGLLIFPTLADAGRCLEDNGFWVISDEITNPNDLWEASVGRSQK